LRPAVTLLAALIAGCWLLWPLNRQPATRGELTMMAAPTVAVLPFKVLGASGSQNDVASAFSEELRSELGRAVRGFDLIIKFATDQRDRPVASKADGARLGVRYLVLGTTWLERDIQHGNVRLVESSTEGQVWSEPFEFAPGEAGALNRTAARTARLVIVQLRTAESRRPLPANPEAGHFALLGNNFRESHRGSKSALEAESLFEKALAIDPNSIRALQGYAETRIAQVRNGWIPAEQWPAALAQAKGAIERTIRYDPNNVQGHYLRGALLCEVGDVDQAIATFEYVLSLNPSYAMAQAHLGRIKIDAGRADEAIEHLKEAILLSPAESNVYLYYFWVGMAVLHLGDDRAAVQWLLKAREADRDYPFTALLLAVAYLGVGEVEKARTSISDFLKDMPRYSIEGWRKGMPPRNPVVAGQRKRIEDALRRLGVAEGRPVSAQH
jgi:tetratricopeptide (TPR) repeat protein